MSYSGTIEEMCGFHVHFVLSTHCSMHVLRGSSIIQSSLRAVAHPVILNQYYHLQLCLDRRTFKFLAESPVSIDAESFLIPQYFSKRPDSIL